MEKPIIDIYKSLRINRIITLSAVITASLTILITVVSSFSFVNSFTNLTFNKILAINSATGEIIPVELKDRGTKENVKIEVADHLDKWFERYYTYDFNNVRKQPLRAQWLIAKEDFQHLTDHYTSWHKEVESKKLSQKTFQEIDSVQVNGTSEPYTFRSSAIVTINNGYEDMRYRLKASGEIISVQADYPKNPHGFLIRKYKENITLIEE